MDRGNFYQELRSVINQNALFVFLFVGAFASFIWLIFAQFPSEYASIRFAPLAYALILILFIRPDKLVGISSSVLCVLYFIKLCVDPIVSVMGDFYTIVSYNIVVKNWNRGCLLLCFEWFIVAFVLWYRSPKFLNKVEDNRRHTDHQIYIKHRQILFGSMVFCLLSLLIYLAFPIIRNEIFFTWQEDTSALAANSGPFFYLFKIFFELGKPLLLFYVFYYADTKLKNEWRTFTQLLIIFFTFVLMSEYRILSILEATSLLLVFMMERYQEKNSRNTFLKVLFLVAILYTAVTLTTHNEALNQTVRNVCRLMDIYTGGFMTATAGQEVHFSNGSIMFLHDIFDGSYILGGIFGHLPSTTDAINSAVNSSAKGIFFESIVQARAMFGPLYPIAIGLVTDFVIRMDYHYVIENDTLYRTIYIMCGFTTAIFMLMYTYTMIVNFIIWKACIWLTILWLDKRVMITFKGKRLL